jgi:hypothetical protein
MEGELFDLVRLQLFLLERAVPLALVLRQHYPPSFPDESEPIWVRGASGEIRQMLFVSELGGFEDLFDWLTVTEIFIQIENACFTQPLQCG